MKGIAESSGGIWPSAAPPDLHDAIPLQSSIRFSAHNVVVDLILWIDIDESQLALTFNGCSEELPLGMFGVDLHCVLADTIEGTLFVYFMYGDNYRQGFISCRSVDARPLEPDGYIPVPWDETTGI